MCVLTASAKDFTRVLSDREFGHYPIPNPSDWTV